MGEESGTAEAVLAPAAAMLVPPDYYRLATETTDAADTDDGNQAQSLWLSQGPINAEKATFQCGVD